MRPVSVSFAYFGSYMEKQEIDFTLLENNGIFLICGDTGAGKTTILDAICCALYGKSSGEDRGGVKELRNKQAPGDKSTFVEFVFETKGKRYLFSRSIIPKKPGKSAKELSGESEIDYKEECSCQHMIDGEFVPVADVKATATFLTKTAEQLVGLDSKQFTQVILLPQGKFETLLTSSSKDKEPILAALFQTKRWEQVGTRLKERAKHKSEAVDTMRKCIDARLKAYGCASTEELSQKAETLQEENEKTKDNLTAAKKLYEIKEQEWKDAGPLVQSFSVLDARKKRLEELEAQQDAFAEKEQILRRGKQAERIHRDYRNYRDILEKRDKKSEEYLAVEKKLAEREKQLQKTQTALKNHEIEKDTYEEYRKSCANMEGLREVYGLLPEKQKELASAEEKRNRAEKERTAAALAVGKKKELWDASLVALAEKREQQERVQKLYFEGIGYELAKSLEENSPCPVCGNTTHPQPAKKTEEHISATEFDRVNEEFKEAIDSESSRRAACSKAENVLKEAENALTQAEHDKTKVEADYLAIERRCIPGIPDSKTLEQKITDLQKKIRVYDTNGRTLYDQLGRETGLCAAAEVERKEAEVALAGAENDYGAARKHWEQVRKENGFEDDAGFLEAVMDPEERDRRNTELATFHHDLEIASMEHKEQQEHLSDKIRPHIQQLEEAKTDAQKRYRDLDIAYNTGIQEMEKISGTISELQAEEEKYALAEQYAQKMKRFSQMIMGISGSNGIGLQRYVLGVMLSAVTAQANEILQKVCGGRYRLVRARDASGKNKQKGLELDVYTSGNAEVRKAKTLSGGEKFLVSLCLAIALSSVVQAQGHGVRMEAMFVDEGFGTLDKNCIQEAMDVLEFIRGRSGMVGIISHVEALSEAIPSKIVVSKDTTGSHCKIVN